ncbi:MAG: DUF1343 domain-containing protein [Saprospiraceae bacterium]|nr:DUF1343 domain-containing protein [Saprospiraceae bacterium]
MLSSEAKTFFANNLINRTLPADYRLTDYLDLLKNKRIAVVVHPCSVIEGVFLVDTLLKHKINIVKIFAPEHGFRGEADAGEQVQSEIDLKTGIPIVSLYGKNKKPDSSQLIDVDLVLFDLQDVGVRFYTYLSTLHYIMEACVEQDKELLVLDRPNPNGHYIDGPILESDCKSFIGIHPIPIVHGMTLAELALMIKGENWISKSNDLKLHIVKCLNYSRFERYVLPVKPSPNLPNERSILLYPSICLLEGTIVSLGRGTEFPFQIYGHPDFITYDTIFTPRSIKGAKNPPLLNQVCKGFSLQKCPLDILRIKDSIDLSYIIKSYEELGEREDFFLKNGFIDLLIGNKNFKNQIISNTDPAMIRKSWKDGIIKFKEKRERYLLYN